MFKSYKYRIYPTKKQSILLNKHIGSSRFIYNLALETKIMAYSGSQVNLSCFDLIKQLPDLKKDCEWLKELNAQMLRQPIMNLESAYARFFKGQGEFPKFKKKSSGGSFNVPQRLRVSGDKLFMPKFTEGIDILLHRNIVGEIRQATISRTPTGKYFASILCETGADIDEKRPIDGGTTVGIDLGIKTYLVTSDGEEIDNPKYLRKAQSKLRYMQRKYSKHKGKRTKQKLVLIHEKVTNQRKDFLHKTSSALIRDNQSIAIEDLYVSGMIKNHKLSQSISDASWGTFVEMLQYKAEWYGVNILKVGRFEPSSKTCSVCGDRNDGLKIHHREWTCDNGHVLDRDVNAAINIKNFALRDYLSGTDREIQNELPTLVGVLTSEAKYF